MKEINDKILLTDRWFPIPERALTHPTQIKLQLNLLQRASRYFTIVGGRRTYKTERFIKRFPVYFALKNEQKIILLGAPTRQQAKNILWEDIKGLVKQIFVDDISESQLFIKLINKSIIQIVGLKEFQRVEGSRAHLVAITEFQQCDPRAFTQSIQPMLVDTQGLGLFDGRPFGKNHLFDFYKRGVNNEEGWSSYHWNAEDILSEAQIIEAKRDLSEIDYRREYKADFETAGTSPYHGYSILNHKKINRIDPELPLIIACDFNPSEKPMSWAVGQARIDLADRVTYWIKALQYQYTNTITMCGILFDYLQTIFPGFDKYHLQNRPQIKLHFYGDYAGDSPTSNSSLTDWDIIEKRFKNITDFKKKIQPCRGIRISIGSTNAQLCNALNQRKQFIDYDQCKPIATDWEKALWKDNARELDDDNPMIGHICRAIDYYNDYETPIKSKTETY